MAAPEPTTSMNPIVFFDVTLGGRSVSQSSAFSVKLVYVRPLLLLDTIFFKCSLMIPLFVLSIHFLWFVFRGRHQGLVDKLGS